MTHVLGWCAKPKVECPLCGHALMLQVRTAQVLLLGATSLCDCGAALELRNMTADRWCWAVVEHKEA